DNPGGSGEIGNSFESTATAYETYTCVGWYEGEDKLETKTDVTVSGNTLKIDLSAETRGKTYTAKFSTNFGFTIETISANSSYRLPFVTTGITGDYVLSVNWGDGTPTESIEAGTSLAKGINHIYLEAAEYTITITSSEIDPGKAQMPKVSWKDDAQLKSINTPLLNTAATDFSQVFAGCTSITSISAELFRYNTAATDFDSVFYKCTSLSYIPAELFRYNTNATDFSFAFYKCTSLSYIPAELFRNKAAATSFSNAFYGCSSLSSIPAELFKDNTKATDFSYAFWECSPLSIPADLFRCNAEATNLSFAFYGCRSLNSIPDSLFRYNKKATNFSGVFAGCTSLSSIPAELFNCNEAVIDFSFAFYKCTSLSSIPDGLFRNNRAATDFSYTFFECVKSKVNPNVFCEESTEKADRFSSLTEDINFEKAFSRVGRDLIDADANQGTFPTLWKYDYSADVNSLECFTEAKASNSGDVDDGWK
ncbi:MAG: hypothetical protein ACRCZZ_00790, partial [Phocaeicola sp.]